MSTSIFGAADEAVYYTLLLMPPSGNASEPFGYTTTQIFDFWVANHLSLTVLNDHSTIELTQALVDSAVALGAARALYRRVTAEVGSTARYIINQITRQLPVESKRFLVAIGVFDAQIQAELAQCKVTTIPFAPSPALASSVQPPVQPFAGELSVVIPEGAIAGCAALAAAVPTTSTTLVATEGTCSIANL